MPENPQPALMSVPFRGTTLFVATVGGRPYVPLDPIFAGMGLDWPGLHAKLAASPQRFQLAEILICLPGADQSRSVCCTPLHRLFALLASIKTKKVAPSLRAEILIYQADCDEALWDCWYAGAVNAVTITRNRERMDIHDDCSLAAECFQELGSLFISIARFAAKSDMTMVSLARIGHERADWWRDYFGRLTQRMGDPTSPP